MFRNTLPDLFILPMIFVLLSFTGHVSIGQGNLGNSLTENISKLELDLDLLKNYFSETGSDFVFEIQYEVEMAEIAIKSLREYSEANGHSASLEKTYPDDQISEMLEKANESVEKLRFTSKVLKKIEIEKSDAQREYHRLWSNLYQSRDLIEKLYVKTEDMSGMYGGLYGESSENVTKRQIYKGGVEIYDDYIKQLKGMNECDHANKIFIIEDALEVMNYLEELFSQEDTKEIEKKLRKAKTLEQKKRILKK